MSAFQTLGQSLDWIITKTDRAKSKIDPQLDRALFATGMNLGSIYALTEIIDNNYSDSTNGLITLAFGSALTLANYISFSSTKAKPIQNKIKTINNSLNKNRAVSWSKTTALAALIYFSANELKPYAKQIHNDLIKQESTIIDESRNKEKDIAIIPISKDMHKRPEIYNQLNYTPNFNYDFNGTKLEDKNRTVGRIQRTLRWAPIFRAIEEKYQMPKYTLAGMIMQESYGNPVLPNSSDDGGLGVVHIQGTTGKYYGLKIFGHSSRDSDNNHGRDIKKMLQASNYNPAIIQEKDERGHIIKVLDAAARIVSEGKAKHGSWDLGIEYYRNPNKIGKPTTWKYLQKVKEFRSAIQDESMLKRAEDDFNKRNKSSFDLYLKRNHEMCNNWGLEDYINNYKVKVITKK